MALRDKATWQKILWAVGILIAAGGALAYFAYSNGWWGGEHAEIPPAAAEQPPSHELVRDAQGRPVKPYTIRLTQTAVRGLKVTTAPVGRAGMLALPAQVGTLGYDTDRLYAVRPRFQGEVIQIGTVTEYHQLDGAAHKVKKTRPVGPGDRVKEGQVLAVLWSKELGDRKVALVTALLDLYFDRDLLRQIEPYRNSVSDATYRATVTKVQKDMAAVQQAESSLGISRLSPKEIEDIRAEAKVIQTRLEGKEETPEQRLARLTADVPKWAKVTLVAPQGGVLVEKNTNVNDMVDPSKDTPLFRIADMSSLLINVNFNEEYLPLLQPLMRAKQQGTGELRWKVRIEAEPDLPPLDLSILRIAPSLDPNNHTAMVIGRITNPVKGTRPETNRLVNKHLIVGQFVTATVLMPPGAGVVDLPTNALNEVNGESLVLVQPNPDRAEYVLRRVAVVRRSREVTQVRSALTPQERALSAEEERQGRRPIEPLRVGDVVVTHGVTEITDAFEGLLALARAEKR